MKRHILTLMLLTLVSVGVQAQEQSNETDIKYRRSSLYSILVNHTDQKFADEIKTAFVAMPTPDKYNNSSFGFRIQAV